MGFEWNTGLLQQRLVAAMTGAAGRFISTVADDSLKLRIDGPGLDGEVSVVPGDMETAMVREYGTDAQSPDRWALPALMEMASGRE